MSSGPLGSRSGEGSDRLWANPLCVALDHPDPSQVEAAAARLAGVAGVLKVGLQAFVSGGPSLVDRVRAHGPVFLDLKLHDIPTQVGGAVAATASLGASLATVHASGGPEMLRAASEAAPEGLTLVAVTVLTSLDDGDLAALGLAGPALDQVLRLADVAFANGIGALVCSPLEIAAVRERYGALSDGGPLLIVPGIRPAGADKEDQRRTLGPREAMAAGADLLVVGRPITTAADPEAAARALLESIA